MVSRKLILRTLVISALAILLLTVCITTAGDQPIADALARSARVVGGALLVMIAFFAIPVFFLRRRWHRLKQRRDMENDQRARVIDRFMRNTPALSGALTIVYATLIAFFAHLIAPDASPYAGDQINELAYKPPGFRIEVLEVPLELKPAKVGFVRALLYGRPSGSRTIPITGHRFEGDSLYIMRYIGEGVQGMQLAFALHEITGVQASTEEQVQQIRSAHLSNKTFLLCTDDLGRDFLSRIILGTRVSLSVGIVAVVIALCIGIPLGALAGFYKRYPPVVRLPGKRRWKFPVDNSIMWMINIIWSIPTLLLVFPIVFAFGQQFFTIFIAVGLTMWVDIARMVRGQVMQVREMEFVQATRTFGYSDNRAIWRHILPNISGPIIVITAANFAYAILTEAGLSFLGIGVQPPAPSWGLMIAKYKDNLITDPYLALMPGFAITLLVLAFFMVGNGLRDALDIRSRW